MPDSNAPTPVTPYSEVFPTALPASKAAGIAAIRISQFNGDIMLEELNATQETLIGFRLHALQSANAITAIAVTQFPDPLPFTPAQVSALGEISNELEQYKASQTPAPQTGPRGIQEKDFSGWFDAIINGIDVGLACSAAAVEGGLNPLADAGCLVAATAAHMAYNQDNSPPPPVCPPPVCPAPVCPPPVCPAPVCPAPVCPPPVCPPPGPGGPPPGPGGPPPGPGGPPPGPGGPPPGPGGPPPGGCFSSRTPVHLVNSQVLPIAGVKAGDIVLSFDDSTQRTVPARVRRKVSQTAFEIVVLHLANRETIETTPRQKFMTIQRGVVPASSLVAGHHLRMHDGKAIQITGAHRRMETTLVHHLELESGAAYHVGDAGARTIVKNVESAQSPGAEAVPSRPSRPHIGPKPA